MRPAQGLCCEPLATAVQSDQAQLRYCCTDPSVPADPHFDPYESLLQASRVMVRAAQQTRPHCAPMQTLLFEQMQDTGHAVGGRVPTSSGMRHTRQGCITVSHSPVSFYFRAMQALRKTCIILKV